MRWIAVIAAFASGCSLIYDPDKLPADETARTVDAGEPDAPPRIDAEPPPEGFQYEPSNFDPAEELPSVDAVVDCDVELDTAGTPAFSGWCSGMAPAVEVRSQQGGGEVAVVELRSLVITATGSLTASGTRPVVLAVYGDVSILGPTDASANGMTRGPGGGFGCTPGQGQGGASAGSSGGGGAGGTFGGAGDDGGESAQGAAGGAAYADQLLATTLVPLRGGCRGGAGGAGTTNVGEGGGAGGSVQVSAAGSLTVSSWISVSGGGGLGGIEGDGAGGGGSGGGILLEADSIALTDESRLTANGGGGGEGGANSTGCVNEGRTRCVAGADGATQTMVVAVGGAGESNSGGDGGSGAVAGTAAASGLNGSQINGGGGGGGGGIGIVRLNAVTTCDLSNTAIVSAFSSTGGVPCE